MLGRRNTTKTVRTRTKTATGSAQGAGRTRTAVTRTADPAAAGMAAMAGAIVAEKRVTTDWAAATSMASRFVCQTTTPSAAETRVSRMATPAAVVPAAPALAVSIAAP